ncbi:MULTISPECIES: HIRAN domain-containing protein [Bacillus cereus group]|uniref:HIRAN domain-containing protein n=1 Tax=Bacillus cereus group TaxID=86661 RepID=UPI0022E2A005|nr:HIRAN domain-containing protein [Bacillus cereus group sp. TH152-1LC]MDA1674673.1 hypothetical protein [Bacillus cereus group sp. TH152-1LC]
MPMELDKLDAQSIKQMMPFVLQASEIKDFLALKNIYFIEDMATKKNPVFCILHKYNKMFGHNEYIKMLEDYKKEFLQEKTAFLNLVLEPRFITEQTIEVIENRHKALEMYEGNPGSFNICLEFEPENPYDEKAIAAYAEGKNERYHIGYISRSFNLRIGALLKEDPFPYIQTNYNDILKEAYSKDGVVLDVYF